MKNVLITLLLLCTTASISAVELDIIPYPSSIKQGKGKFQITAQTHIKASNELTSCAEIFANQIKSTTGKALEISDGNQPKQITLSADKVLATEEYRLEVTPKGVAVTGGSAQGVFYGLQTLRQIIAQSGNVLPAVTISDAPRMAYRGMMLDVCRHFFTVDQVKSVIDMMSLHKLNRLQWHLTDDQGWRIEIKRYPKLTEIGSVRKETLTGPLSRKEPLTFDGKPYGGFYTQEQIREVIAYAAARHIEVVPELEMPGHGVAALSAYPWLGCTGGPYSVWTRWGISDDVYCAGKESTFEFIENVLSEVIALFPSKYIHIGGDECPKSRWKECPDCQQRIKSEGLKDEAELQSYFVHRVADWLEAKGRTVIGWDEVYSKELSKSIVIMTWREQKNGTVAAQAGSKVIMTPKFNCYFDYRQTSDPARYEPLCQMRYLSLRQAYRLDPYDQLTPAEQQNILGVQANLWTEYIPTLSHLQHMALPRLAALSERGWSYDRRTYDDFVRRLATFVSIYRSEGYNYADYVFSNIE